PTAPGGGTALNSPSFAPVRASYARGLPMPPLAPGGEFAPTTTTFLSTRGTELYGTTKSTSPLLPKLDARAPVFASSAINRRPAVKTTRGGSFAPPGQYATPRRETAAPATACSPSSLTA